VFYKDQKFLATIDDSTLDPRRLKNMRKWRTRWPLSNAIPYPLWSIYIQISGEALVDFNNERGFILLYAGVVFYSQKSFDKH
jgi:hypothetical protein